MAGWMGWIGMEEKVELTFVDKLKWIGVDL